MYDVLLFPTLLFYILFSKVLVMIYREDKFRGQFIFLRHLGRSIQPPWPPLFPLQAKLTPTSEPMHRQPLHLLLSHPFNPTPPPWPV